MSEKTYQSYHYLIPSSSQAAYTDVSKDNLKNSKRLLKRFLQKYLQISLQEDQVIFWQMLFGLNYFLKLLVLFKSLRQMKLFVLISKKSFSHENNFCEKMLRKIFKCIGAAKISNFLLPEIDDKEYQIRCIFEHGPGLDGSIAMIIKYLRVHQKLYEKWITVTLSSKELSECFQRLIV